MNPVGKRVEKCFEERVQSHVERHQMLTFVKADASKSIVECV
jgi:hypothetical protein